MPSENKNPGQTEAYRRVGLERGIRQRRQPAWPLKKILVKPLAGHERGDAAHGVLPGLGAQRMVDRLANQAVLLEPRACAAVAQRALQVLAQKVLEQVMVAIPVPLAVQADEKQVGLVQVLQHRLAGLLASHGIAERPTDAP